jgi:hypothetical protein
LKKDEICRKKEYCPFKYSPTKICTNLNPRQTGNYDSRRNIAPGMYELRNSYIKKFFPKITPKNKISSLARI